MNIHRLSQAYPTQANPLLRNAAKSLRCLLVSRLFKQFLSLSLTLNACHKHPNEWPLWLSVYFYHKKLQVLIIFFKSNEKFLINYYLGKASEFLKNILKLPRIGYLKWNQKWKSKFMLSIQKCNFLFLFFNFMYLWAKRERIDEPSWLNWIIIEIKAPRRCLKIIMLLTYDLRVDCARLKDRKDGTDRFVLDDSNSSRLMDFPCDD